MVTSTAYRAHNVPRGRLNVVSLAAFTLVTDVLPAWTSDGGRDGDGGGGGL